MTDRNGALIAKGKAKEKLSDAKKVSADGGYSGEPFALAVKNLIGASVEIMKRNELHKFVVIPNRWVVE